MTRDLRPDIWRTIRRLGQRGGLFDVLAIRGQLRGVVARERIRDYCQALQAGGYLVAAEMPDGAPGWQLLRDPGIEPPRVRRDGTPVVMGAGREQCWRAMRILKEFGVRELLATANSDRWSIAEGEAADYCQRLARAGILLKDGHGAQVRYRLPISRYTGPRPLQIRRTKEVFDPNTGTLYSANGEVVERGRSPLPNPSPARGEGEST